MTCAWQALRLRRRLTGFRLGFEDFKVFKPQNLIGMIALIHEAGRGSPAPIVLSAFHVHQTPADLDDVAGVRTVFIFRAISSLPGMM